MANEPSSPVSSPKLLRRSPEEFKRSRGKLSPLPDARKRPRSDQDDDPRKRHRDGTQPAAQSNTMQHHQVPQKAVPLELIDPVLLALSSETTPSADSSKNLPGLIPATPSASPSAVHTGQVQDQDQATHSTASHVAPHTALPVVSDVAPHAPLPKATTSGPNGAARPAGLLQRRAALHQSAFPQNRNNPRLGPSSGGGASENLPATYTPQQASSTTRNHQQIPSAMNVPVPQQRGPQHIQRATHVRHPANNSSQVLPQHKVTQEDTTQRDALQRNPPQPKPVQQNQVRQTSVPQSHVQQNLHQQIAPRQKVPGQQTSQQNPPAAPSHSPHILQPTRSGVGNFPVFEHGECVSMPQHRIGGLQPATTIPTNTFQLFGNYQPMELFEDEIFESIREERNANPTPRRPAKLLWRSNVRPVALQQAGQSRQSEQQPVVQTIEAQVLQSQERRPQERSARKRQSPPPAVGPQETSLLSPNTDLQQQQHPLANTQNGLTDPEHSELSNVLRPDLSPIQEGLPVATPNELSPPLSQQHPQETSESARSLYNPLPKPASSVPVETENRIAPKPAPAVPVEIEERVTPELEPHTRQPRKRGEPAAWLRNPNFKFNSAAPARAKKRAAPEPLSSPDAKKTRRGTEIDQQPPQPPINPIQTPAPPPQTPLEITAAELLKRGFQQDSFACFKDVNGRRFDIRDNGNVYCSHHVSMKMECIQDCLHRCCKVGVKWYNLVKGFNKADKTAREKGEKERRGKNTNGPSAKENDLALPPVVKKAPVLEKEKETAPPLPVSLLGDRDTNQSMAVVGGAPERLVRPGLNDSWTADEEEEAINQSIPVVGGAPEALVLNDFLLSYAEVGAINEVLLDRYFPAPS